MLQKFIKQFGNNTKNPVRVFSASGRVNIIGEHIDYNGGYVFPVAISLGCTIYSRLNNTNTINIAFTTTDYVGSINLSDLSAYKNTPYINYQAGVADVLKRDGIDIYGCDLLYDISVPFGSGLSSSAAIEVATAFMLTTYHNNAHNITAPIDLVKIAIQSQKAENVFVGVNCGIMDQFASANGLENKAVLLDCATLKYDYVDFNLNEYALVVINTNRPHSLVTSKYNERRGECETALKQLQTKCPNLKNLCELSVPEFNKISNMLSGNILARATHCVSENSRVLKTVQLLKKGDIKGVGELLTQSHVSLRDLYLVSCKELDVIVEFATKYNGCAGARMTGAGFGGSAIAIVLKDKVNDFTKKLAEHYNQKTNIDASIYNVSIANGAREIKC